MTARSLTRHYPALSAPERFELLVQARARGDTAEAARLAETCPESVFRERDPAFVELDLAAEALVDAFATDLGYHLGRLEALRLHAEVSARVASALGSVRGRSPRPDHVRLALEGLFREEATAVWKGFAEACVREWGLDPKTLVRAYLPELLEQMGRHGVGPEHSGAGGEFGVEPPSVFRELARRLRP